MSVKSTVLTKTNFDISSLIGKRIIGRIQSGNPDASLPMHGAWINVYQEVAEGTPNSTSLSNLGFYENTINKDITLGVEHFTAIPDDFRNSNVVVKYEGNPDTYVSNIDCRFAFVSLVNLDPTIKAIVVVPSEAISELTEKTNLFFAVTYKCEPTSEHYHVVWAKLTLDPHADPNTWVQVMWYLENQ